MDKTIRNFIIGGIFAFSLLLFFLLCTTTVDRGTVKVGYRMGGSYQHTLQPGFYVVNPLNSYVELETRDQTEYIADLMLPTSDQLKSTVDVSIQYAPIGDMAHSIISNTSRDGSLEPILHKYIRPKVRELVRQGGRSVGDAYKLYEKEVIDRVGKEITEQLQEYMSDKGVEIKVVLVRDVDLPVFIKNAIEQKKQREQQVEEERAEFNRFEQEQRKLEATASARLEAAAKEAEMIRLLAQARADEIEMIKKAAEGSPAYIQIKALETLGQMAKDPAAKIIMMDGSSSSPIPLLNLGSK